jgi:hypothetical protein
VVFGQCPAEGQARFTSGLPQKRRAEGRTMADRYACWRAAQRARLQAACPRDCSPWGANPSSQPTAVI